MLYIWPNNNIFFISFFLLLQYATFLAGNIVYKSAHILGFVKKYKEDIPTNKI